ncbi:ankyrin repeat-containing domain protein [Cadophora sp. MPI-SDFR-AT-0126]|nr:ankyrin repeat-containing domain protein [Leotiomycetes sp. MPI-SDFR-AT-0126]
MNHGADVRAVTYEGLNLLHISSRARQSNIVGLLIEKLVASSEERLLNGVDDDGRTPLHYACRSGRPETVSLLLKAGADVSIMDKKGLTPLHACAEFEEEKILWATKPTGTTRAYGILLADKSRPDPEGQNMPWGPHQFLWEYVRPGNQTARIREIIQLLIKHGAEIAFFGRVSSPINLAVQRGCADMVDELLPLMEPIYVKAREENGKYGEIGTSRNPKFQEKYLLGLSNVKVREEDLQNRSTHISLCNNLLSLGHLKALEQLPNLGVDFSPNNDSYSDFLTTLVKCGYAELFQVLGDSVTTPGWINGIISAEHGKSLDPYLVSAVNSDLPNLDIVKIAVERFKADVNIQPVVKFYPGYNTGDDAPGPSPLHILASATRWWQTDAMVYLLGKGANTELKNQMGQSVLNYAVSPSHSSGTYRRRETVKILLENGADPNSLDNDGMSCLNHAMYDLELVTLLIEHGADVAIGENPVLFSAITSLDVAAVSVLLKAGADCNAKQKPVDKSKQLRYLGPRVPDADSSPLHHAASNKFNTPEDHITAIEIIKLLLEHGADPYLTVCEDATLVHDIFKTGGIIQPFLDFEGLDLEQRDQNGRTALLAASQSRSGTREPSQMPNRPGDPRTYEARMAKVRARYQGDLSAFLSVYQRGGNLEAVDNEGNSVFHFLAEMGPDQNKERYEQGFNVLVEAGQTIIDLPNNKGSTPLHVALAKSNWWAVRRLMDAGADLLLKDPDKNNPLHHLACANFPDHISKQQWLNEFLELGVPIDEKNNLGQTPLFKFFTGFPTVKSESQEPFSSFLKGGADIFTRNNEGETLLHVMAKKVNHTSCFDFYVFGRGGPNADGFKFLMNMGLDPMAEDKDHKTPLASLALVHTMCSSNHFAGCSGSLQQ